MRIAVIGGGISGMLSWYLLQRQHEVIIFEANDYLGGHTATVDVSVQGKQYAIDTGFIVFNDWTYPIFNRFISELNVDYQHTEMSFSVKNNAENLEYNGNTLSSLFAQRRNLFRPSFWRMLLEINRFNKLGKKLLGQDHTDLALSLGEFLTKHNFSQKISHNYLLPMGAAIWSSGLTAMPDFPVRFFLRFFNNHGLLNITDRPQWAVIKGGSRNYVQALQAKLGTDSIRLKQTITKVLRDQDSVTLQFTQGHSETFDKVVFACHSDQALALLGENASENERQILANIAYKDNEVILHTDTALLPKRKKAWAAWNYNLSSVANEQATLTYNMNILQGIEAPVTFCVTLNNTAEIDNSKILGRFMYQHPVYNQQTLVAQARRQEINGQQHSYFCGAYWYNGFHEDGAKSAVDVAALFGIEY
ncbi:NAD(P)/FAD-dependent oxidoreductase [Rheinheimera salexigens]|uniref:FAD-dependent oxidoreductase n=1 Tax=Rheinheimera salexigens TaxID=1628148 RepID=A0A1E7Q6N4_9GAMM|nr:FAD-dependent oxidoreductase [Rheinheimera salexigens]OEY69854.1 FAD-dependent oxidoreductase [Rheinheimera salexigens]